jgi:hypothetical protein
VIVYTRNGNEFVKTGSLQRGTRSVRILIDGRESSSVFRTKKAIQICDEAIRSGHAHANRYEIIEATTDSPALVASRTAKRVKARNRESFIRKLRPGGRFFVQRSKGGRYSIGDVFNHDSEMFPSRFKTETEAQKFIDEYLAEA